jgi:hypothetical protein
MQGRFYIGLLSLAPGRQGDASAKQPLSVRAALQVPSRAHGLCPLPDGSVLAVARRPGDWLVRWHPGRSAAPQWLWQAADERFADRTFNGHMLPSPDGKHLYTTETDVETGASLVGVRDARTLHKLAEWPTHGVDAHELIWDHHSAGSTGLASLIVANGGVPTAPETGRAKRDMHRMDSSLVRLDAATGDLLGQWRLDDPRLSLRHLAWNRAASVLGIALQAEHDEPALRHAAPVYARFDGQTLRTISTASTTSTPGTAIPTHTGATSEAPAGTAAATQATVVAEPHAPSLQGYGAQWLGRKLPPRALRCAAGRARASHRAHCVERGLRLGVGRRWAMGRRPGPGRAAALGRATNRAAPLQPSPAGRPAGQPLGAGLRTCSKGRDGPGLGSTQHARAQRQCGGKCRRDG